MEGCRLGFGLLLFYVINLPFVWGGDLGSLVCQLLFHTRCLGRARKLITGCYQPTKQVHTLIENWGRIWNLKGDRFTLWIILHATFCFGREIIESLKGKLELWWDWPSLSMRGRERIGETPFYNVNSHNSFLFALLEG